MPLIDNATDAPSVIYNAITDTFASKNPTQLFSLCWPGTVLDPEFLEWDPEKEAASGIMPERCSVRTSLILDQYIPPAPITQPDGTRVSDRYRQVITSLGGLPDANLARLQDMIRKELNQQAEISVDGKLLTLPLIDAFSKLNGQWVAAKQSWSSMQTGKMEQLKTANPTGWWNQYLTWYENNSQAYIDTVNAKYEQLISQFPLATWEDAISILDTKDHAGLVEAKQILRNVTIPVPQQEGLSYVPATGVPYDWPLKLRSNTKFLDLLTDPESQQMKLDTAIEQLRLEVMSWLAIVPQVDDLAIKNAAIAMDTAVSTYGAAQDGLLTQYNKNAISAVNMVCDAWASKNSNPITTLTADTANDTTITKSLADQANNIFKGLGKAALGPETLLIDAAAFKNIAAVVGNGQDSLIEKQSDLVAAGRTLAKAADTYLGKEGTAVKFPWLDGYKEQLNRKIDALEQQRRRLEATNNMFSKYASNKVPILKADNKPMSSDEAFGLDSFASPLDDPNNAEWTEVKVSITADNVKSTSKLKTSFQAHQWGVDLFFASASGSSNQSDSDFKTDFMKQDSSIQLGFLAKKVLIRRPWMKPELLNATSRLFRTTTEAFSPRSEDSDSKDIFAAIKSTEKNRGVTQADLLAASGTAVTDLVNNYTLPAYPVAMLLVKDLSVKVEVDGTKSSVLRQTADAVKSQGGGFFCFSASSTESSHSESDTGSSYSMAGQFVARSPAPQIIGYWLQLTPPDNSRLLQPDENDPTISQIKVAMGFLTQLKAAHDATPVTQEHSGVAAVPSPAR